MNLHKINLISIDLDGTLLRNDLSISQKCLEVIREQKDKGKVLVFNTSRPLKLLPEDLYNEFYKEFWLLSNGAFCIKAGIKIFENVIESNNVKSLATSFSHIYKNTFFSVESGNEIFSCFKVKSVCEKYFSKQISLSELTSKEITKFLIIDDGEELICLEKLKSISPEETKILITDNNKYIQIMPVNASKLLGIKSLLINLNISLENVLSFGDDFNDYELIKESGIGVAMGNAHSTIKKVARFITKSNIDSGIHYFFSNIVKVNEL